MIRIEVLLQEADGRDSGDGVMMTDTDGAVVKTTAGSISGGRQDGLHVFKGIPYAAPPVGERRWLPPQPVEAWSGVRPAKAFGPISPQNPVGMAIIWPQEPEPQDEDCLYLNIWTPGLDDTRRPVLFWIHGGGFTSGSGSDPSYDGSGLAKRGDEVVVTINYRMGALGFLNLNEATSSKIPATGNEGLLDQTAALEWVHDNIAAFGGDPDNVTIFGESAGGMSVGCQMVMPSARGLFHKAIPQSGATSTAGTMDKATRVTEHYLRLLGISDTEGLRAASVEKLLAAQQELDPWIAANDPALGISTWQPVIDGTILAAMPIELVATGVADGIPVLVGSTVDEWKLLIADDEAAWKMDEAGLLEGLRHAVPAEHLGQVIDAYRAARQAQGLEVTPVELFSAIQTDRIFRLPAIQLAEALGKRGQPAYHYIFTWQSPIMGGILGACHALEVGFLFGVYEKNFSGSGPEAAALSASLQDIWTSFARNGNPSCASVGEWPVYGERRETMLIGKERALAEAPFEAERLIWEGVPDEIAGSL